MHFGGLDGAGGEHDVDCIQTVEEIRAKLSSCDSIDQPVSGRCDDARVARGIAAGRFEKRHLGYGILWRELPSRAITEVYSSGSPWVL